MYWGVGVDERRGVGCVEKSEKRYGRVYEMSVEGVGVWGKVEGDVGRDMGGVENLPTHLSSHPTSHFPPPGPD